MEVVNHKNGDPKDNTLSNLELVGQTCECLTCGRNHRPLGTPPWSISHDDACRLGRVFNQVARLDFTQDYRINEWLKRLIVQTKQHT